eukprot:augustus_masked-scaffold_2-processed-gene-15.40-mRNA-1 protein AED:1.00 eAED:1.00 QI:0/-1/0/0/-1/1/1/0/777
MLHPFDHRRRRSTNSRSQASASNVIEHISVDQNRATANTTENNIQQTQTQIDSLQSSEDQAISEQSQTIMNELSNLNVSENSRQTGASDVTNLTPQSIALGSNSFNLEHPQNFGNSTEQGSDARSAFNQQISFNEGQQQRMSPSVLSPDHNASGSGFGAESFRENPLRSHSFSYNMYRRYHEAYATMEPPVIPNLAPNGTQASTTIPQYVNQQTATVENAQIHRSRGSQNVPLVNSGSPRRRSSKITTYCLLIKSRTREHTGQREIKRTIWFEGKVNGVLKIGSDNTSGLQLKDDRCEKTHALIKVKPSQEPGRTDVVLYPQARMYKLIGKNKNKLCVGSVIKAGSISLEVINMNVSTGEGRDDAFLTPYRLQIVNNNGKKFIGSINKPETDDKMNLSETHAGVVELENTEEAEMEEDPELKMLLHETSNDERMESDGQNLGVQTEPASNMVPSDVPPANNPNNQDLVPMNDVMCYICWGAVDVAQHAEYTGKTLKRQNVNPTSPSSGEVKKARKDSSSSQPITESPKQATISTPTTEVVIDTSPAMVSMPDTQAVTSTTSAHDAVSQNPDIDSPTTSAKVDVEDESFNPMIVNPCGTCNGCSRFVHYKCLMHWIATSKSGHCSICNNVLPPLFCSKPPNLELKIIRHRRGQHWVGTRRFRLSFAGSPLKSLGSSQRADVKLQDVSVSDVHCFIKYDPNRKQFTLHDNDSRAGTYMQLTEPVILNSKDLRSSSVKLSEFKIGRSTLNIRVMKSKDKASFFGKVLDRTGLRSSSFHQH